MLISYLVLTILFTLTFALPNITTLSDPSIRCHADLSLHLNPDCATFLRTWATHPSITGTYDFGSREDLPGKIPLLLSGINCQLRLQKKTYVRVRYGWFETMRLRDYWPRLWIVEARCLGSGSESNWGKVDVGVTGVLEVVLSGKPLASANGVGDANGGSGGGDVVTA